MKIDRICLTEHSKEVLIGKTLIYQHNEDIGILSHKDTLYLKPFKYDGRYSIYKDELHNSQLYTYQVFRSNTGIVIFITPQKPYKSKVYALILKI